MLFNTLTTLALATIAVAAPSFPRSEQDLAARDAALAVERGLIWAPRSLEARKNKNKNKNKNENVITITQLEESQLSVSQRGSEIQFTQLVEEKLVIIDETKRNKDNIRKNHFRNKNNNVNTIIVVVTVMIDDRDSKNRNTRYMTHQVHSNEDIAEQQIVVVSDFATMTIGGGRGSKVRRALPTGTGSVAPNVETFDPSAPPSVNNSSMILPAGVSAPNFDNSQVDQDPAVIIQKDQAVFVSFVGSS